MIVGWCMVSLSDWKGNKKIKEFWKWLNNLNLFEMYLQKSYVEINAIIFEDCIFLNCK